MDYVQYPNYTTEFSAFEVSSTVGPCKITLFEVSTALFHLPIASNEVDVPKKMFAAWDKKYCSSLEGCISHRCV